MAHETTITEVALYAPRKPRTARKPRKMMKRSLRKTPRLKRKNKPKRPQEMKRLKKELWELCRQITAKRYPDVCFTCDKPVSGSNRQLGHFIPRSVGGNLLKYNLDNLRWQCFYDNINLGGNGSEFYRRLVNEIGIHKVDSLFVLKKQLVKADVRFFSEKITEYQQLLNNL